jgi:hypothetical protein
MKLAEMPRDARLERTCLQHLKIVALAMAAYGLVATYFYTGTPLTKLLLVPVGLVEWCAVTSVYKFANGEIDRIDEKYGVELLRSKRTLKKRDPPCG